MPKSFQRNERVADAILRALSPVIQREMSDPRIQWVTLSEVKMSPKLAEATVFFTLLNEVDKDSVEKALNHAAGFLRSHLAKTLPSMRYVPHLRFVYDDLFLKASHVTRLIEQVVQP